MGRGPGGRGVLGGGDALAGAGAGRLAACRDDGWRGEACASVSVAVAGTWDRVGRKKRISFFFFRGAARCRAGTRGVGRGASSDLSHAPRRSSRLPSLGLSLSRRPAGLAPWGAGLGAWGRGDGTGEVSRAVSGWRPGWQRRLSGEGDRVRLGRRPSSETRARRSMRAHSRPSSSPPSWSPPRTFPLRGWAGGVRVGQRGCALGRRAGGGTGGGPRHLVFPGAQTNHGGRWRAGDRGIDDVASVRLTVNQGIRRRVHVAAVLLEHGDDILLSLAGDRDERLNLVLRHLSLLSV